MKQQSCSWQGGCIELWLIYLHPQCERSWYFSAGCMRRFYLMLHGMVSPRLPVCSISEVPLSVLSCCTRIARFPVVDMMWSRLRRAVSTMSHPENHGCWMPLLRLSGAQATNSERRGVNKVHGVALCCNWLQEVDFFDFIVCVSFVNFNDNEHSQTLYTSIFWLGCVTLEYVFFRWFPSSCVRPPMKRFLVVIFYQ